MTKTSLTILTTTVALLASQAAMAGESSVGDDVVAAQRAALAASTAGAGFGPQAPRDIENAGGENAIRFALSPAYQQMNLCNIHFHKNAEHRGGQFTSFAGNGDGKGFGTGFEYSGTLTAAEATPLAEPIANKGHGGMQVGDTIEQHYVFSSAQITPGPTLGACLSEAIGNPQLRVETQVFVLVNDDKAADLVELNKVAEVNGYWQPVNMRNDTGAPVQYAGSTTGPSYNEKGSPFQVSWSVRPDVIKLNIKSVDAWLKNNRFNEDHAHGVRNLVQNPALLSSMQ